MTTGSGMTMLGRRCWGWWCLMREAVVGTRPRTPPNFLSPLVAAAQAPALWKKFPPPSPLHSAASIDPSTFAISSNPFPFSSSRITATLVIPDPSAPFSTLAASSPPPNNMSEITHPTIKGESIRPSLTPRCEGWLAARCPSIPAGGREKKNTSSSCVWATSHDSPAAIETCLRHAPILADVMRRISWELLAVDSMASRASSSAPRSLCRPSKQ